MNARLFLVAPIMLATSVAGAQEVRVDANCVPQMTRLEARLYQKASEGPDALRDFIWIRRGIYQLDIMETATWASGVNAAQSACKTIAGSVGEEPNAMPQMALTTVQ